jgi:hypothetical protein
MCVSTAIDSSRLIESGLSSLTQLDISPVPWGMAAPVFRGFDLAHRLLGGCPSLRPQDSEELSRCLTGMSRRPCPRAFQVSREPYGYVAQQVLFKFTLGQLTVGRAHKLVSGGM